MMLFMSPSPFGCSLLPTLGKPRAGGFRARLCHPLTPPLPLSPAPRAHPLAPVATVPSHHLPTSAIPLPAPPTAVASHVASPVVPQRFAMGIPFPPPESLKAVLFDVDGTLCDSDPLHVLTFREMLQEVGFQNGEPITEEFFIKNISGMVKHDLGVRLFPEWDLERRDQFLIDQEVRFRSLAAKQLKPVEGLESLCRWIEKQGLKRAAVANAPRENADLIISLLGLSSFFEFVIVGGECERAKPFPDPYQMALKKFGITPDQAFVLEDSSTGLRAAVAAGIVAVGLATRNPEHSLLEAGAAFVITDFNDTKLWNALEGQP